MSEKVGASEKEMRFEDGWYEESCQMVTCYASEFEILIVKFQESEEQTMQNTKSHSVRILN